MTVLRYLLCRLRGGHLMSPWWETTITEDILSGGIAFRTSTNLRTQSRWCERCLTQLEVRYV